MSTYSIYLHIPFCKHRCAYCDFNTYAGQEDSIPAYVDALCREIEFVGNSFRAERSDSAVAAHTIFFGGGTPSLLSAPQFISIMDALRASFALTTDAEITIEANPGTVSLEKLQALRKLGINRISFGVQSANGEELHMLERTHTFFDVIEAVSSARKAGFNNLNLDLIYGLPEQTLETWQTTVRRILDLHPEHISAYALTLEHGTPFGRWSSRGILPLPDPDLAAEMYEWASETFEANGYVQYEISNWAKPGRECRHNLQYWRGLPYLGLGAGAHGYADGYRYSNVLRIKTYIERMNDIRYSNSRISNIEFPLSPATVNQHRQSTDDDMSEFMMTGLRLTREGIAAPAFRQRFGSGLLDEYPKEINELINLGLLEWAKGTSEVIGTSDVLRLTSRGRLLGNQVFMRFIE
ncbi:MAG: radical SAM family heme chaperone HemW [Chloroflexi bacterium]|nr:radical SAM family heme chaperone HemW [Chloroflexota bacterium]